MFQIVIQSYSEVKARCVTEWKERHDQGTREWSMALNYFAEGKGVRLALNSPCHLEASSCCSMSTFRVSPLTVVRCTA